MVTDEQLNIIISKMDKLDGIIEEVNSLYSMINAQLNNLGHGRLLCRDIIYKL